MTEVHVWPSLLSPYGSVMVLRKRARGYAVGHQGRAKHHMGIDVRDTPYTQHLLLGVCVHSNPALADKSEGPTAGEWRCYGSVHKSLWACSWSQKMCKILYGYRLRGMPYAQHLLLEAVETCHAPSICSWKRREKCITSRP